jgi:hypothetical protein
MYGSCLVRISRCLATLSLIVTVFYGTFTVALFVYLFLSYIMALFCFIDYVMMNVRMIVQCKYELEKMWK